MWKLTHFIQVKGKKKEQYGVFNSIKARLFHQIFWPTLYYVCSLFFFPHTDKRYPYYPASRVFFDLTRKEDGTQVDILRMCFRLIE